MHDSKHQGEEQQRIVMPWPLERISQIQKLREAFLHTPEQRGDISLKQLKCFICLGGDIATVINEILAKELGK